MLYHFIYPLSEWFSAFNVFGYITFRSVFAFIISFILCLIIFPKFIAYMKEKKAAQIIRDDGPQTHKQKVGTPTMGGLVVILAIVVSLLICGNFKNLYILIIIACSIGFAFIGFLDDYLKLSQKSSKGLHAKFKLISQILLATVIVTFIYIIVGKNSGEISIPFLKNTYINLSFFYIPFGVFFIVGFSNAVNLTDGLDGLAGGLLIAVTVAFGILSYLTGHKEIANYLFIKYIPLSGELLVYCFAMIGGLCGFLWFNAHPAEIFMGDAGSLSFGGIIGTIALMIKQELLLLIIAGVFVAETLSVIIQVLYYKSTKKRFFKMAPLHHHFELMGWKETKVISRFWIIGGILSVIALGSLKLR
ncbi:MAG: phospho-N-acetylmuramoyl-pentapeptide-transferase [Spirochaetes bacterium]|nr:phospho-N-acetylmuramoyl-pentapeptide-transferase [Spirochaetota bacterium]